ncbi:hypothetical protein ACJX0J_040614 [Zea mays]
MGYAIVGAVGINGHILHDLSHAHAVVFEEKIQITTNSSQIQLISWSMKNCEKQGFSITSKMKEQLRVIKILNNFLPITIEDIRILKPQASLTFMDVFGNASGYISFESVLEYLDGLKMLAKIELPCILWDVRKAYFMANTLGSVFWFSLASRKKFVIKKLDSSVRQTTHIHFPYIIVIYGLSSWNTISMYKFILNSWA